MSPFRWDVLICGFGLGVPVLLLGLRGDLSADEVATRLVWCLGAGWVAVALVRFASAPRRPTPHPARVPAVGVAAEQQLADGEAATS